MLREDRELLADLRRACLHAPQFALEYMAGHVSIEVEEAYALSLIDIGERLLAHAKGRKGLVFDREPTQLVIEAPFVRVELEPGTVELPPGSAPSDGNGS